MLYLHESHLKASPKAISGRTSYLRVRLEFLRYPHLITTLFNGCVFGPPRGFTLASSWTWIGHPVSGLQPATSRAFHTRFPFGFVSEILNLAPDRNSPDRSTKSTPSSLTHKCAPLRLLVNIGFQVLFHSPPGVLFTFPSLYFSSIGHQVVFRLGGWSLPLPAGFHVSRGTLDPARCLCLSLTGLSPSMAGFPNTILLGFNNTYSSPQPRIPVGTRFGLLPFRSPLLWQSSFLSLPVAT